VAWGDFARFVAYTAKLNWFVPASMVAVLAWASTFAEALLGLALVVGFFTRAAALLSGLLLLSFAMTAGQNRSEQASCALEGIAELGAVRQPPAFSDLSNAVIEGLVSSFEAQADASDPPTRAWRPMRGKRMR